MTAVNPSRLENEIAGVLTLVDDHTACARECMRMLEYYADRMKRSGDSADVMEGLHVLHVPNPVVRQLGAGLAEAMRGEDHPWEQVACALWEQRYREAQLVAIAIVGVRSDDRVPGLVRTWALECDDSRVFTHLADQGLDQFRTSRASDFYIAVEEWLGSSVNRLRHLGLLALSAVIEAHHAQYMPTILRLIQGVVGEVRGEARQALYELVRAIAGLSPLEIASLLMEEVKSGTPGIERMIRETSTSFPPRQKQRLEDAIQADT
jgi:hypothetical protein